MISAGKPSIKTAWIAGLLTNQTASLQEVFLPPISLCDNEISAECRQYFCQEFPSDICGVCGCGGRCGCCTDGSSSGPVGVLILISRGYEFVSHYPEARHYLWTSQNSSVPLTHKGDGGGREGGGGLRLKSCLTVYKLLSSSATFLASCVIQI